MAIYTSAGFALGCFYGISLIGKPCQFALKRKLVTNAQKLLVLAGVQRLKGSGDALLTMGEAKHAGLVKSANNC